MSEMRTGNPTFPPVRACIFDIDGLLVSSEDIYTEIYNNILHSYGKPNLPWRIKAKQQSRGREGMLQLLDWAQLPITYDEWTAKVNAQHELFTTCTLLPGVFKLLLHLSSETASVVYIAIASSSSSKSFKLKTDHLPDITSAIAEELRVFGDDAAMSEKKKKPMPDLFLLALERINARLEAGGREVKPDECLVFEDSVAGVEAGRRAGMRVCWVPHKGLREVWRGQERMVLDGRTEGVDNDHTIATSLDREKKEKKSNDQNHLRSEDGRAEMLASLEEFDYEQYGIRLRQDCV